jgi:precorrin-3B C17-methyltransferase
MLDYEIGMSTTVIIGNSDTFAFDRWMVTPRGYQAKYDLGKGAA